MIFELRLPEEEKWRCKYPKLHGTYAAYDGRRGKIIAYAGNGGAWVQFDPGDYVGCPLKWLHAVEEDIKCA